MKGDILLYNETRKVALPDENHRIILKQAKYSYVYYFSKMYWDPDLKRTVDDRIPVGRVCRDDPTMMYPNEKWIQILGEDLPLPHKTAKYMNVGPYLAFYKAAEKIGCLEALRSAFPKVWDKLFALCVYVIDDESAVAQLFPFWGYHNYCGFDEPFSDSTISELYKTVSEDDWARDSFMEDFQKQYFVAVPHPKEIAVALDGTNHLNRSKNNKYCEYGHPKVKGKGIPQTNTALIVDEMTGIPIYVEEFYGSLLDMIETPATMERVRSLGFPKMLFAVDSGYASADCIESISKDFEFTVMTPESYIVYKDMLAEYGTEIARKEKYYIFSENVYGICKNNVNCFSGKYNVYLFFDPDRAQEEIDSIHAKTQALLELANKRKRYTDKFRDKFAPHLVISKMPKDPVTGKNFKVEIDNSVIQEEIENAGFFTVVSNSNHTPERIIKIQRMRDKDEKAFSRFNSFFGMTASGTHGTATYEGKNFMGFVALIVAESFRWYVKDLLKSSISTEVLIGELRKLQCWKNNENIRKPATGITKHQKEIFECLGMDEQLVLTTINKLPH